MAVQWVYPYPAPYQAPYPSVAQHSAAWGLNFLVAAAVDLDDLSAAGIPADPGHSVRGLDEERGLNVHVAEVAAAAAVVDEAGGEGGADVGDVGQVVDLADLVDLEELGEDHCSEAACSTDSLAMAFGLFRHLEALHQARAPVDRSVCPAFANVIAPKHGGRC